MGEIHFRFLPPASSRLDSSVLVGRRVKLFSVSGNGSFPGRELEIGPELDVHVDRVVPGCEYKIDGDLGPFARAANEAVRVEPGKTSEVEIDLLDGAVLRGHVLDESGSPVPGASLSASGHAAWGSFAEASGERLERSVRDGGLARWRGARRSALHGFVPLKWDRYELDPRGRLDDLLLVLTRTRAIRVRVLLPDGRP
jgi:hypothetical protein